MGWTRLNAEMEDNLQGRRNPCKHHFKMLHLLVSKKEFHLKRRHLSENVDIFEMAVKVAVVDLQRKLPESCNVVQHCLAG